MDTIIINPVDFGRTFTLIARHDTHYFIEHELPRFLDSLSKTSVIRCRNYIKRLRSGEYIPKACYSDRETDYVYLTIGQFSGRYVSFEDLTFLEESIGEQYAHWAWYRIPDVQLKPGKHRLTLGAGEGACFDALVLLPQNPVMDRAGTNLFHNWNYAPWDNPL